MKKKVLFLVSVVMLFFVGCASINNLKGVGTGSKESAVVDIGLLETKEGRIIMLVSGATISFLESYSKIFEALGNKEFAEKCKASAEQLKANPKDSDKLKEQVGFVNKATEELNKINLEQQLNEELAKKYLYHSILHLGIGMVLDGMAVPDAASLVNDARNGLVIAKKDPMKYGPTAVAKLTRVAAVAEFISSDVASQVNSIGGISKSLYSYATTKGIPLPTQDEINKKAKELEKE